MKTNDWVKKLGQWHLSEFSAITTLCKMPMLGNNYAKAYPESERNKCPICFDIATDTNIYVIAHCLNQEQEYRDEEKIYWNNRDGWQSIDSADQFNAKAKREVNLPIAGQWEILPIEESPKTDNNLHDVQVIELSGFDVSEGISTASKSDWAIQYADGSMKYCSSENEACQLQREHRINANLNTLTGEPNPEFVECKPLTINQALQLSRGDVVHYGSYGECLRCKVIGPITQSLRDNKFSIPLKVDKTSGCCINQNNFNEFHLESECVLNHRDRRLTMNEMILFRMSKESLAEHYGLKPNEYDTAIPQGLFDKLISDSFDPYFQFVYTYKDTLFGTLMPLTTNAVERMKEVFPELPIPPVFDK